jgi:hypothetical protein
MKGEVNDTLRDRVHAPCTLKSESVHGECKEVCTRLHACTPRKTHAHRPLQSLQDGSNQAAPTPPAGYIPRKMLISSGIWRTISENPCQKISKYSPNLTKYKHTKRARVQSKQGIYPPPPQNDQIGPEGGRVYILPGAAHARGPDAYSPASRRNCATPPGTRSAGSKRS